MIKLRERKARGFGNYTHRRSKSRRCLVFRKLFMQTSRQCKLLCTEAQGPCFLGAQAQNEPATAPPTACLLASSRGTAQPQKRCALTVQGAPRNPKTFTLQTSGTRKRLRGRFTCLPPRRAPTKSTTPAPPLPAASFTQRRVGADRTPLQRCAERKRRDQKAPQGGNPARGLLTG